MIRLTAVIEVDGQAPRALTHESNARAIVLGRDGSADFQIPLSTISRQHVRITETDGVYVIEDLGSTHGTMVNGKKLDKGEKKVLRNADVIELTKAKITASIEEEKVASVELGEGTQAIAAKAVQGILGRLGQERSEGPFFRVIAGPDEGARYSLSGTQQEWAMGRSKDCEFVLNDPNVSRKHAIVKKDWNGFTIQDLGSKNGVLVNDKLIGKPRRLKDRDEVTVGPVRMVFIDPDAELMDALKDVPGFAMDDPQENDGDPSLLGAPGDEAAGEAAMAEGEVAVAEAQEPEPVQMPDEPDYGAIDPDLLATTPNKLPIEWIVIGGVALLIVGAVITLFAILA